MKFKLFVSSLLFVGVAFADSTIECTRSGGSEAGLRLSPEGFEVEESGPVTLRAKVGTEMVRLVRIEVAAGSEAIYYATKPLKVVVAANKDNRQGEDVFNVQACVNEESTTASYTFQYRENKKTVSAGTATYKCTCSAD